MTKLKKIDNKFLKLLKIHNLNDKFNKCESDDGVCIYTSLEEFELLKLPLYVFLTPMSFSFHSTVCNISTLKNKQEAINIINYLNVKFASSPIKVFLDEDANIVLQAHIFFCEEEYFNEVLFLKNYGLVKENINSILSTLVPLLADIEKTKK